MARSDRAKRKPTARGRVTKRSGRYTPATPRRYKASPPWLLAFMLTTLICGVVIIMTAYFGLEAGGTQLLLLLVGAGFVTAGVTAATRYR